MVLVLWKLNLICKTFLLSVDIFIPHQVTVLSKIFCRRWIIFQNSICLFITQHSKGEKLRLQISTAKWAPMSQTPPILVASEWVPSCEQPPKHWPWHHSAAEMSNERVTYAELNVAKHPRKQQRKPRGTRSSISATEQEITYAEFSFQNACQEHPPVCRDRCCKGETLNGPSL